MNKPKVILVGGCPGAGKTTLASALAAQLCYRSLTIDDLLIATKAVTSPDSHPGLHVMNQPNYIEYFTHATVEKLIADATLQHQAIWPAVAQTIQSHSAWGTPIVIDGWHLWPEFMQSLKLESVSAHWLVIEPGVLEARERQNKEFVSKSDHPQQMLDRFLARSLWHNTLIHSQAQSSGDQILRQDGSQSVTDLCRQVTSSFGDVVS